MKKQRHYFATKGPSSQSYHLSSSHVWMGDLDYKESWVLKYWCFGTVVLEKTLESPLDCKEIKPVNRKGNQSWIFIGRTDAEAEAATLWLPDAKGWLSGKVPDAGEDWGQEEKGVTEDEMVGWNHCLNGHGFEQTLGYSEGWGSRVGAVHEVVKSWTWLSYWTTTMWNVSIPDSSAGKESACNAETGVWSLGWEDPLEKGKATHSSILAWRIPWTV